MNPQELQNYSASLSPANFNTDNLSARTKQQIHQDSCEIVRTVVKRNMVENGLALIQTTAMNNVANLSLLEQQLVQIAPNAEPRLRALVDSYTVRAGRRLGGDS